MVRGSIVRTLVALLAVGCQAAGPTPNPTQSPTAASTAAPTNSAPTATEDPDYATIRRLQLWGAAIDTIDAGTVKVQIEARFGGSSGALEGARYSATGATSLTPPARFVLAGDFSDIGMGNLRVIVDDTLIYLQADSVAPTELEAGQWLLVDITSDDPRAASFAEIIGGENDASTALAYLFGANPSVREQYGEQRYGLTSRHFILEVDLRYVRDVAATLIPSDALGSLDRNLEGLRESGVDPIVNAEAWIADGLLFEFEYTFTLTPATGGTLTIKYVFSDHGEPLDLGIPHAEDVVPLEDIEG